MTNCLPVSNQAIQFACTNRVGCFIRFISWLLITLAGCVIQAATPGDYFAIRVVDADTGRGIPLVELRTTDHNRYFSDSNGYVAFFEPGLMDQQVWFDVGSWGYESPAGPYGTKGVAWKTTPGTEAVLKLERQNLAERLYRQTGVGIYRDTVLLGKKPPLPVPLINAQVTGCDSVQTAIYRGRMRWFWQDTNQVEFALGSFRMTGATSPSPQNMNADNGIPLKYFVREPNGFAKELARVKQATSHPIWVDGMMVVRDEQGHERLVARYVAARKDFSVAQMGMMIYDDSEDVFIEHARLPLPTQSRLFPKDHPVRGNVNGREYFYIGTPPNVRVPADFESVLSPGSYQGLTCFDGEGGIDRDDDGRILFSWKTGKQPITTDQIEALIRENELRPEEAPWALRDIETNAPLKVGNGSVAWNPFLKQWTLLFCEQGGDSFLGEVWFAVANAPEGPWVVCQKIATHARPGQNMDFYNPMQHPELMREDGRVIYFEGTFVNTFSGTTVAVPRYNYNQLMYRLDVSDERLQLPHPPSGLSNARPSNITTPVGIH
ncbi:hypothetical protein [Rhodopirellula sp. P2]|uniref:hypothetical protein n=1 Tax=Rhodopirellula sp. P2 TaxID=2127060 RepID=UPI002367823C|nr:hypothetical protein [Rhodopirellula sp. P2]WDQ15171.1 hypothetical protein PSR62_16165 [Rhodopirellula sp. P2]